jgi:hypothetical protein
MFPGEEFIGAACHSGSKSKPCNSAIIVVAMSLLLAVVWRWHP